MPAQSRKLPGASERRAKSQHMNGAEKLTCRLLASAACQETAPPHSGLPAAEPGRAAFFTTLSLLIGGDEQTQLQNSERCSAISFVDENDFRIVVLIGRHLSAGAVLRAAARARAGVAAGHAPARVTPSQCPRQALELPRAVVVRTQVPSDYQK